MLASRLACVVVSVLPLLGCYATATHAGDAGARVDASAVTDAARNGDTFVIPLRGCDDAPTLGLDTTETVAAAAGVVPAPGSCWDSLEPYVFRRVEVPALTGVEIRTDGADAPVAHFFEGCAPAGERCVSFGPSGFFAPFEPTRTTYYGNPSATPRSLIVAFWWVGDGETPFVITTRSGPVAEHGACDRARSLEPGELVPAATARGGTYESWSCWYLPESHFYDVEVPARHVALPLEGSQALRATGGCDCAPLATPDPLVNLSSRPTTLHLEAEPSAPLGVRFEPLPDAAICEAAPRLLVDGLVREIERFPRLISGIGDCVYNDPHHYTVEIPALRSVEVELALRTPYPAVHLLGSCGDPGSCERAELSSRGDETRTLRLDNTSAVTVTRHLVVGSEGPAEGTLEGTMRARLVEE